MEAKATAISSEQSIILSMLHGMWQNRCLSLVVGLKIPDLLCNSQESSLSIEDIAIKSGCTSSKQLYPIMKLLAQWGIGKELENKHFAKNQAMELLRRDKGPSLGHLVEYLCSEEHFSAMRSMAECVRNGQQAFVLEHGMSHTDYMNDTEKCSYAKEKMFKGSSEHLIGSHERRKEMAENHQNAMAYSSYLDLLPDIQGVNNVYTAFPWSTCNRLVDMGGCSGYFLATVLQLPGCEHIQGYVVDLPDVIDEAQQNIQNLGIPEHRIEFMKHDFTKPFSRDLQLQVDTVMFKSVMSMFIFDHGKMIEIFRHCRSLFPKEGGRILIIDNCSPDAGDTEHNVGINGIQIGSLSVHMLSISGLGKLSKSEWVANLKEIGSKSGYQVTQVYDTFEGGCKVYELSCNPTL
ncbi:hypothetical protein QZH41_002011 [Actinostola sp. cb2023]|nr:hypothetical protein QZH41_002011 [Actinostola sp. cb2023]